MQRLGSRAQQREGIGHEPHQPMAGRAPQFSPAPRLQDARRLDRTLLAQPEQGLPGLFLRPATAHAHAHGKARDKACCRTGIVRLGGIDFVDLPIPEPACQRLVQRCDPARPKAGFRLSYRCRQGINDSHSFFLCSIFTVIKTLLEFSSTPQATKEVWGFRENRMAVRFAYEWHDAGGQWFRSYGNELWEFDEAGLMRRRIASINDLAIAPGDRLFHWPQGRRPDDHPGLSDLGP